MTDAVNRYIECNNNNNNKKNLGNLSKAYYYYLSYVLYVLLRASRQIVSAVLGQIRNGRYIYSSILSTTNVSHNSH